jgi:2-dehydropantoate 2-reductase
MKIVVMAAGGVGGYYGARLAASGEDVHFIARGAHLATLRTDGLKLKSPNDDLHLRPVSATDDPRTLDTPDVVIFAVKQYDTAEAARLIAPLIGRETAVISVQNGMDPQRRLQTILGREAVMGGTAYITGAAIVSPGVITHTGPRARLIFGEYDGGPGPRGERFLAACDNAKIDAALSSDIVKDMWTKFALLTAFSGVTSMMRKPAGAIMCDPDTRKLLVDAIAETTAVADAKGVDLGADFVERHKDYYANVSPDTKSSMLMDLENHRRLELEWLSGAVARFGEELGVPTPVHRSIYDALKRHANGGRVTANDQ